MSYHTFHAANKLEAVSGRPIQFMEPLFRWFAMYVEGSPECLNCPTAAVSLFPRVSV
jgi:hypothetical protein